MGEQMKGDPMARRVAGAISDMDLETIQQSVADETIDQKARAQELVQRLEKEGTRDIEDTNGGMEGGNKK